MYILFLEHCWMIPFVTEVFPLSCKHFFDPQRKAKYRCMCSTQAVMNRENLILIMLGAQAILHTLTWIYFSICKYVRFILTFCFGEFYVDFFLPTSTVLSTHSWLCVRNHSWQSLRDLMQWQASSISVTWSKTRVFPHYIISLVPDFMFLSVNYFKKGKNYFYKLNIKDMANEAIYILLFLPICFMFMDQLI